MKAEDTLTIINDALAGLATDLAGGRSEQLRRYLAFLGRFHAYSMGNIMLIWSQRPDSTRVAGYRTWLSMGRHVKRGEKGIGIVAPMKLRSPKETTVSETPENSDVIRVRFRIAHVFDIAQTEGEDVPKIGGIEGDPGTMLDKLKSFASGRGIIVESDASLGTALGVSRGGRISLRPGLSPAEEFSTLAHELAHELMHQHADARPDKTIRELEAEAVAYAVANAAGLSVGSSSCDYIHLYQGDENKLLASLARIRETAHQIVTSLVSEQEAPMAAA